MYGIRLSGRMKRATSTLIFAEHDTNEHEACVVHVLLDLDCASDLQAAKVGALVLQDIIGTYCADLLGSTSAGARCTVPRMHSQHLHICFRKQRMLQPG